MTIRALGGSASRLALSGRAKLLKVESRGVIRANGSGRIESIMGGLIAGPSVHGPRPRAEQFGAADRSSTWGVQVHDVVAVDEGVNVNVNVRRRRR